MVSGPASAKDGRVVSADKAKVVLARRDTRIVLDNIVKFRKINE